MSRGIPSAVSLLTGLVSALALAACSPASDSGDAEGPVETNDTVAGAFADRDEFSSIARVLADTGVAGVFDGAAAYTVLAPTDEALGDLLADGGEGMDEERRVVMIALLRKHVLPGHLTTESIREAIAQGDGQVEMRTLADGVVTFSLEGDTIVVTGEDGGKASLGTDTVRAGNGAIIPLDAPIASLPQAR